MKRRELEFSGVYRVPAASLKALGNAPEGEGAPDVELVTKGARVGVVGCMWILMDWGGLRDQGSID